MLLKSFMIVDRRDGSTFQVWAKDRKDAQAEYMSAHGNYWKDSDYAIVLLHARMRVGVPEEITALRKEATGKHPSPGEFEKHILEMDTQRAAMGAEGMLEAEWPPEALEQFRISHQEGVPTALAKHPIWGKAVIATAGQGPMFLWAEFLAGKRGIDV